MDTTFDYSGELKPEGEGRRLWDWLHAECDGIEALPSGDT
jgi:hypothetical protein